MIKDIVQATPMAVFADRSRDALSGRALLRLAPARVFQVTDNHRRIRRSRLKDYDVLAICSNSPAGFGRGELDAIRWFVRRGGGVLLAANAGAFERATSRSAPHLAANAVARLFGFEFLSAANLKPDIYGQHGYAREQLVLTPAGRRLGIGLGDIKLGRAGPIAVPKGATVLLRRKGGPPVAATARFGRGRILAYGDLDLWNQEYPSLAVSHWVMAVAPARRKPAESPPAVIDVPYEKIRKGPITLSYTAATRDLARDALNLALRVWAEGRRIFGPNKTLKIWCITLDPGIGFRSEWYRDDMPLTTHVGGDSSPAVLAEMLARLLGDRLVSARLDWEMRTFWRPVSFCFQLHVLEKLGLAEHAGQLRRTCAGGPRIDLGRLYSEVEETAQLRRLWVDIVREFGPNAFGRFVAAVPKKDPCKHISPRLYGDLDRLAFFLARAVGTRAYRWLESQGHTLRRIPLRKPGSAALKRAMGPALTRLLTDPDEPASDRFDALCSLADFLAEDKISFDRCARKSRSPRLASALPAAARLLLARDARGAVAAGRFIRNKDKGLAAAVALLLAFEARDADALDVLVRLSGGQDVRFRISAGYALQLAGDGRAKRFAFRKLPGCRMRVVHDGAKKVFPTVEGYEVANVWCLPYFFPVSYEAAFSTYYVEWVHTSPRWRRCGLARLAMTACLDHHWDRECATTSLHTETRNVAHSLYRQYRLIDYWVMQMLKRTLRPERPVRPPRGISIRPAAPADAKAVAGFLNKIQADRAVDPVRLQNWPDRGPAFLAFEGRKLVAVASAHLGQKNAALEHIAVAKLRKKDAKKRRKDAGDTAGADRRNDKDDKDRNEDRDRREKTGLALLSRLHRDLLRRKKRRIGHYTFGPVLDDFGFALVRQAGYATERGGLVELHRINSLAQFLEEMAPVFERRLSDSKIWREWKGTIVFDGGRLRAEMKIDRGSVSATDCIPRRSRRRRSAGPLITIRGPEESVERIALGVASPFEEHMQLQCKTIPTSNPLTTKLLETLLPRIVRE